MLTYLFHRLEARFDGRPTLLILDEAWTFLDDALFAARIREWLKTLRKKNVAVVFATQSLADIERSTIAPALIESCPTRIFLPNDRALEPQAQRVYERFGLNARQIEILSIAAPKRDYYAQTARGNRLFELGLGPVALALCGASSPDDQRLIDRCLADGGSTGFAARFLDAKGLAWAAELIGRWPSHAMPPPIPQASVPIDPAEGAPPATATPRQPGTTPSPKAAAPADVPRTNVAPLPGLPGGPPMPERLSPFRRDATQIQEERPMKPLRKTFVAVPVIVGVMASCVPQSAAQLTVFDPANYQENLLSAARALEQINNQVRQLQAQAQMLLRMDQNLLRLGSTISPDLQRTLGDIQAQLRAGDGIALRLQATQSGYDRLFPREVSAALSTDDLLRNAKSRWDEEYAALRRAALLQGQIADSVDGDVRLLGRCHGPLEKCCRRPGGGAGRQRVGRPQRQAGAAAAEPARRAAARRSIRKSPRSRHRGRSTPALQVLRRHGLGLQRSSLARASGTTR